MDNPLIPVLGEVEELKKVWTKVFSYGVRGRIKKLEEAINASIDQRLFVPLQFLLVTYDNSTSHDEENEEFIDEIMDKLYRMINPKNLSEELWKDLMKDIYYRYADALDSDKQKLLHKAYKSLIVRYPNFSIDSAFADTNFTSYREVTDYLIHSVFNQSDRLSLAYFDPEVRVPRYPKTQRPITSMPFAPSRCHQGLHLPVVRYDALYYEYDISYCGTFYYYEPDSGNYLNLGKCLMAGTKAHALTQLLPQENKAYQSIRDGKVVDSIFGRVLDVYLFGYNESLKDYVDGEKNKAPKIFKDKYEVPPLLEWITTIYQKEEDLTNVKLWDKNGAFEVMLDGVLTYKAQSAVGRDTIFGGFDALDQLICSEAKKQGYDTVLLQKEIGLTRLVTEVLDVRDRNVSYASICKEKRFDFVPPIINTKYPTIWFNEYGFMDYA